MTGMAKSAARMVEDGDIEVGAELWRGKLTLVLPEDSGIGESSLMNAFFRL